MDVQLQHLQLGLHIQLMQEAVRADARVVDEHVDVDPALVDSVEQLLRTAALRQIGGND
ncbi:hypothetical protein D3C86_2225720 [compost metagenome]